MLQWREKKNSLSGLQGKESEMTQGTDRYKTSLTVKNLEMQESQKWWWNGGLIYFPGYFGFIDAGWRHQAKSETEGFIT